MNTEQVVIYRSRWEVERDQFFFENPEYILYIFLGCLMLAGVIISYYKIKNYLRFRR